ncbi:hypothetical protein AF332_12035 [Sporosarcina globispora]|uniref:Uncharacterized protein n=1 Tax=Sporosarcina globispora TaxID=1459 RepID=A0A0M0GC65_SPOGL|nr:hypothetical protein [Sporosarcina globispora]KON87485.1 hypothetical protein AF332_12035 [Sporosarcina globispora]
MDYHKAVEKLEGELWAKAMDLLDNNTMESKEYKEGVYIAKTIDEYSNLIHNEMLKKFGKDYSEKFK